MKKPEALIVPTDVLLLDQVIFTVIGFSYWSRGDAVKVCVPVASRVIDSGETVIDVRTGDAGSTVTLAVPTTPPLVAFTRVVPSATAVNTPVEASIVPTDVLLLDHVISTVIGSSYWSRGVAVKAWFPVGLSVIDAGKTVIEARTGDAIVILYSKPPASTLSSVTICSVIFHWLPSGLVALNCKVSLAFTSALLASMIW